MNLELDYIPCPHCEGEGQALGQLGSLLHLRCRACGWDFNVSMSDYHDSYTTEEA